MVVEKTFFRPFPPSSLTQKVCQSPMNISKSMKLACNLSIWKPEQSVTPRHSWNLLGKERDLYSKVHWMQPFSKVGVAICQRGEEREWDTLKNAQYKSGGEQRCQIFPRKISPKEKMRVIFCRKLEKLWKNNCFLRRRGSGYFSRAKRQGLAPRNAVLPGLSIIHYIISARNNRHFNFASYV